MNDFDYEVKQKKALARNAIYKKGGSKSKKCTLPSDRLTKAEWKRRNGKVESYSLNKPLTYKEWAALPDDLEREYYEGIRAKYHASKGNFCTMLGCSRTTLGRELSRLGYMKESFGPGAPKGKMSAEEARCWAKFLEPEEEPAEPVNIRNSEPTEKPKEEPKPIVTAAITRCPVDQMTLKFTGDVGQLIDCVVRMLTTMPDNEYTVDMRVRRRGEGE